MFLFFIGFLEVKTPVLSTKAGGAVAKPFKTFHEDYGIDMFMRIAPELYLKRMIIGGFDKVYEIGDQVRLILMLYFLLFFNVIHFQFRNESLDSTHNPEFTTLEFYSAYWDRDDVMSATGRMMRAVVGGIFGEEMKVPYVMNGRPVRFFFGRNSFHA